MMRRSAALLLLAALMAGCDATAQNSRQVLTDYAVYDVVIREHFLRPATGEHGLLCDQGEPASLSIESETRPLWTRTARRDSAAAAELPAHTAPLVATLRTLDTLPRRSLAADSFAVGVPVRLEDDTVVRNIAGGRNAIDAQRAERAPAVIRFSRVAYTADGSRALVYAVKTCRERPAGEDEEGAYGMALLVPLERRGGRWSALDPVYLHVD